MPEHHLPIFPLPVVLFPDSILPLHIFEERYEQLINKCLVDGKEFGINCLQENNVAKVGCTAVVTKLLKRYGDGRMDILVQGHRRYSVKQFVKSPALYSVGSIKFMRMKKEVIDASLAARSVQLHNQLSEKVYRDPAYEVEYTTGHTMLSFELVQKAGMTLAQRQTLLELDCENERLHVVHTYSTEVIPRLERLDEVERVTKSDGYIVN